MGAHKMALTKMRVILLILAVKHGGTAETGYESNLPGSSEFKNKTAPQISCRKDKEYPHESLCCLNCEAGKYVKSYCTRSSERGVCEDCEPQTYTEHPNGLPGCLHCTVCRKDEETVEPCTRTQDAKCRCKPGSYCLPTDACEVCKKCTICKDGEEVVKNCTHTSNTVCRKGEMRFPGDLLTTPVTPAPDSSPNLLAIILPIVVVLSLLICLFLGVRLWRKWTHKKKSEPTEKNVRKEEESYGLTEMNQNQQNLAIDQDPEEVSFLENGKPCPVEDEDNGLGGSVTTSSSQNSLQDPPMPVPRTPPSQNSPLIRPPIKEVVPPHVRLVPVEGEENALKKSFDLFEDYLDVRQHNKFFRSIGLSDNIIWSNNQQPGERVYQLLKIWMEKQGRAADLNDLIITLYDLDQKHCAEQIISKVIEKGLYKHDVSACC